MSTLLKSKRLAWVVVVALVFAVGLMSYISGSRYLAAVHSVEHTLSVEGAIDETLSLLKDAETGQRGFLLTGQSEFLEPYDTATREVPSRVKRLAELVAGDQAQRRELDEVRALIALKFRFIGETLELRRAGDVEHSLDLVLSKRGKVTMDRIRAHCRRMAEREQQVLALRRSQAKAAEQLAIWGVGSGSLITLLLAFLSLATVNRDVQELRQTAEELAKSEQHYRLLTEQSSDLVRLLTTTGRTTYVSPAVERLLGYTVEEFLSLPPLSLMHPDELEDGRRLLAEIQRGDVSTGVSTYRLKHKTGDFRWFEVRWAALRDENGAPSEVHTVGRDVTERRDAERQLEAYAEKLRGQSLRDELTGLYNRRGFLEQAEQSRSYALRDGRPAALLFIDLNGMKRINDELGHDAGDDALRDAADVLTRALRAADVVGRLGGDEYVAFALDFKAANLDGLRRRLRELCDARASELARPFRLSMSLGAAFLAPGSEQSLEQLLDQADMAMYEQKKARRAAGNVSIVPPAGADNA